MQQVQQIDSETVRKAASAVLKFLSTDTVLIPSTDLEPLASGKTLLRALATEQLLVVRPQPEDEAESAGDEEIG